MAKTKTILVATREIAGGTKDKNDKLTRATLKAHEELTPAKKKDLGLDADAVDSLKDAGVLIEVPVHSGETEGSSKAEKDAIARADAADAKVAELEQAKAELESQVTSLTEQLEAAQKLASGKTGN